MLKKFIAALVAGALVIGTLTTSPVYADEAGVNATQQADANTQRGCDIGAELGVSYSISIPKLITLNGVSGQAVYSVTVAGDIAGNQKVLVIPEESFLLHESGRKADVRAVVEQAKTEWNYLDLWANEKTGTTAQGTVSAPITAGTWSGNFMFNLSLEGEIETPGSGDIDTPDTPETPEEPGMTEEERLAAEAAAAEALAQQAYDSAVSAVTAKAAALVTVNGSDEAFDTENEVHDYLEAQYNEAVAPYDYTATVNCVYVAPVHGTRENPTGVDGSYTYSVSITNGSKSYETEELVLVLSAVSHNYVLDERSDYAEIDGEWYRGYHTLIYKCSDCGDTYTVVAPHEWNITEGWNGYQYSMSANCDMCGASTQFDGPMEFVEFQPATCEDWGWGYYQGCLPVGVGYEGEVVMPIDTGIRLTQNGDLAGMVTSEIVEIPALGHNYVNEVCTRCGANEYTAFTLTEENYQMAGITRKGDVVIPSTFEYEGVNYKVTSIGTNAFYYCTALKSVIIPDGVTSIGDNAFSGCKALTSVTIPDSVTSIGEDAFDECIALTSINMPDSITSIGTWAFHSCEALTSITIPNGITSIDEAVFAGCRALQSVYIPNGVTTLGEDAFSGCTALESVNIPNSVTTIVGNTFASCEALTSITIPDSVTYIGPCTFANCKSLKSVNIPNGVTEIGWYTFMNCVSLKSITIPNSVTSIYEEAFDLCGNLATIYYNGTATGAPWGATKAKVVLIPGLYTANWTKLADLTKEQVESGQLPNEKTQAVKAVIPDGTTSIGKNAFADCRNLKSVTIPDSVTSISNYAFKNCYDISSITIPNSVTSIGNYAFDYCEGITFYYGGTATGVSWGTVGTYWGAEYSTVIKLKK